MREVRAGHRGRDAVGQRDTSALEADEQHVGCAVVALHDLVGDTADDAAHVLRGHERVFRLAQKNLPPEVVGGGYVDDQLGTSQLVLRHRFLASLTGLN